MTTISEQGARINGSRIYTEFQKWVPKSGPHRINGTNIKQFTLLTNAQCWILKPIRRKE